MWASELIKRIMRRNGIIKKSSTTSNKILNPLNPTYYGVGSKENEIILNWFMIEIHLYKFWNFPFSLSLEKTSHNATFSLANFMSKTVVNWFGTFLLAISPRRLFRLIAGQRASPASRVAFVPTSTTPHSSTTKPRWTFFFVFYFLSPQLLRGNLVGLVKKIL